MTTDILHNMATITGETARSMNLSNHSNMTQMQPSNRPGERKRPYSTDVELLPHTVYISLLFIATGKRNGSLADNGTIITGNWLVVRHVENV